MLASCKQVTPGAGLERDRELLLIFFPPPLPSSWSGWRKRLFQLDVRLSSGEDLAHSSDAVLQEAFV